MHRSMKIKFESNLFGRINRNGKQSCEKKRIVFYWCIVAPLWGNMEGRSIPRALEIRKYAFILGNFYEELEKCITWAL
jgi:hypothetical protein